MRFLNTNLVTRENLAQVEAGLKVAIAETKTELIKWMVGIVLSVAALQTTLVLWLLSGG